MGCYDSVNVQCPRCGELSEFQSKGGDCVQAIYTLDNAPGDVLSDINRHSPNRCEKCGTVFDVKIVISIQKEIVIVS